MEITVFAPVLIPTLNRFNHFKRCVESLSRCTHAQDTELIVGIDYPPEEKYVEGWKKICQYVPSITGFKKITVLNRDHNFGASENIMSLKRYARKYYDRFIFSEDDNEFSPNFLDFINKGLDVYKDNPRVFGICGYNYNRLDLSGYSEDYYFSHEMSAWGYGSWFCAKCDKLWKTIREPDYLVSIIKTVSVWRFLKDNAVLCNALGNVGYDMRGDAYITYYQRINDVFCAFPKLSLVRNHGHDGSGLHSGLIKGENPFSTQPIDSRATFESSFDLAVREDRRIAKQLNRFPGIKTFIKKIVLLFLIKAFIRIRK